MRNLFFFLAAVLTAMYISACNNNTTESLEQRIDRVSRAEMESVCQLLGDDLFEGRAPGTRGGELAEITMQGLFPCISSREFGIDHSIQYI